MEQKDNMLEEKRIEENIMGTLPVRRLLLTMAWPILAGFSHRSFGSAAQAFWMISAIS